MTDKKHKRKKQPDELKEVIDKSSKMDSSDKDLQNGTKKLKKKKKKDVEEFVDKHNGEELSSCEKKLKIKKKKKKRKRNDSEECVDSVEDVSNIVSEDDQKVKKKKKKKRDSEVTSLETKDICEIGEHETKKKHKKKKRHPDSISPPSDNEEYSEEAPKAKKKKKHKKNKDEENVNVVQNETDHQICEENQTEEIKSKKKKNKKSKDKDESYCNNDNDMSTNNNPLENGTTLGQWSTASFEDKQRTEKFQRLLGGMKKDMTKPKGKLFGGLIARSGGNSALDKEGQEQLNKNLQAQYDGALSMRLGSVKGIGFGFTPPPGEGKKFYIDTGKSSSMKFDD